MFKVTYYIDLTSADGTPLTKKEKKELYQIIKILYGAMVYEIKEFVEDQEIPKIVVVFLSLINPAKTRGVEFDAFEAELKRWLKKSQVITALRTIEKLNDVRVIDTYA